MKKLKILLVDDEVDYCTIMKSYFQSKGYEVDMAFTLRDGMKMLEDVNHDILILDNNLPDGKGWDYLDAIIKKYPFVKIYLISAYRQKSDVINSSPKVTVWEKPISLSLLDSAFG
jgi:DNA-binding response OmpR family regulator